MANIAEIKKNLIEKYGESCAICGAIGVPLQIMHIIPKSKGGENIADTLLLVCQNCNIKGRPREIEFVYYLSEILRKSTKYKNVLTETLFVSKKSFRADISAELILPDNQIALYLIECKNYPAFTKSRLNSAVQQLKEYKKYFTAANLILAFPGRLSEDDIEFLSQNNIEAWDIDFISNNFKEEIKEINHPYFQPLFQSVSDKKTETIELKLLNRLKNIPAGKEKWASYQKLIGVILENLFCPPLNTPISESSDQSGTNRRDFIIPNYSNKDFWYFMREMYHADYIVVDAKNLKGLVQKKEALQVGNYLKLHGAGLFAMIICRNGINSSCEQTIRELWIMQNKLIIILDDNDVEAMLLASSSGGNPEDVIKQKIEEFRLSI